MTLKIRCHTIIIRVSKFKVIDSAPKITFLGRGAPFMSSVLLINYPNNMWLRALAYY